MKHNVFISYCRANRDEAAALARLLTDKGVSVFWDLDSLTVESFEMRIRSAIADCDFFVPLITDEYLLSEYALFELEQAVSAAAGRAKEILPLVSCSPESWRQIKKRFGNIEVACLGPDRDGSFTHAAAVIAQKIGYASRSALLYDKLAELSKIAHQDKQIDIIGELMLLTVEKFRHPAFRLVDKKHACGELLRLYERLSEFTPSGDTMLRLRDTLCVIKDRLFGSDYRDLVLRNLYFCAVAVRLTALDSYILAAQPDTQYAVAFSQLYQEAQTMAVPYPHFTRDEIDFIKDTYNRLAALLDKPFTAKPQASEQMPASPLSSDDQTLISIAAYLNEGHRLFDRLRENGIGGDFLKCLLMSYERLKNYCDAVGANDITAACVERIVELRHELDAQTSAQTNEKAENGIKSLLGLTLRDRGNYDVFISFKHQDEDMGEALYRYFKKSLKEPFWSKVSLPELSESDYEKAIYAALENAKHFVVVLSDLRYLEDTWVEREMRIFHREINEHRKPADTNFIFVVTDHLYDTILASNKTLLPIEYRGYQIIKMSEYEDTLLSYIR